jgi:hypothetical protein
MRNLRICRDFAGDGIIWAWAIYIYFYGGGAEYHLFHLTTHHENSQVRLLRREGDYEKARAHG